MSSSKKGLYDDRVGWVGQCGLRGLRCPGETDVVCFLFPFFFSFFFLVYNDNLIFLFIYVDLYIFKFKIRENRLLVHSPDSHNSQPWAKVKPGTRTFFQIAHVGDKGPNTQVFFHYFSWALTGNWITSGVDGTPTGTHMVLLTSQAAT